MQEPRRLRVLFVPDMLPWVTGTIAREVARWNPWIEPTICSTLALRWYMDQTRQLPVVDVVHLLTEYEAETWSGTFHGRVPVVHSIHHVEDWNFIRPFTQCDAIHVIANQWRDYLFSRGVEDSRMVSMTVGVDTDAFAPASDVQRRRERRKLGIADDEFVIGFCAKKTSNTGGRKAPEVYIEGVRRLHGRIPRATALIVGPGWSEVMSQFRADGIKMVWVPFVEDHPNLARLYRSMDAFWVTSRIEGGPVPLLEAMACGTPCVSTRVGIAEEVIEHGRNGFLVPFDDTDAFVDTTAAIAAERGHREIGQRGREMMLAGRQWKQTCASAVELYTRAVSNFVQSHGRSLPVDIKRAVAAYRVNPSDTLGGIPHHLREPMRVHEHRLWIERLKQMNERGAARRYAAHALGANVISSQRWSLALETFDFRRIVRAARWIKGYMLGRAPGGEDAA